nr:hypothetical protein [Tanacetum cinerariifolium]
DKAMLLQAKENGALLDVEAEAFLVDDEHLDSDDDSVHEDYTILYDQYLATKESQDVPTEASPIPPTAAYMLQTLTDLTTQVEGHRKVIVACNKRNAELKQETELLKTILKNKEATIASLTSETKTVLSEKKTLEDKYLEEIVCLKNANQVATGLLQKFQLPTQTIPMLSKRPMIISNDIHKIGLGLSNSWFGRKAQLSQPTLYDGHRLLQPGHAPVMVSDSHETLHETKELSREQVYWLSASDIASQSGDPPKPVTPFVHTHPVNSEVHTKFWKSKECLTPFEEVIKKRTAAPSDVLYHQLSKASTHFRNTSNEKIAALNAEIAKMKPSGSGTKVSGPKTPEKPKVVAPWMYAISSKYITPPRPGEWAPPTPRKKHVTVLPTKNKSARRVEDYPRNLNKRNNVNSSLNDKRFGSVKNVICDACKKCLVSFTHDKCYVRSVNTMHAKKPQVARPKMIPKNVRKTDITIAYRIVPQWKPTDRQFILCDIYGPKKSKAPTAKPLVSFSLV